MLIRYSYGSVLILVFMGVALGVLSDIYRGGDLAYFSEPFLWMLGALLAFVLAGFFWLVLWGKLTKDSLKGFDTIGRIRTIKWSNINQCAYFRLPGFVALRLYDETSHFAVWLHLPAASRTRIEEFISSNAPSSLATKAIVLHSTGTFWSKPCVLVSESRPPLAPRSFLTFFKTRATFMFITLVCYTLSLALPAIRADDGGIWSGLSLLCFGWLGFLNAEFRWLANGLFLLSVVLLLSFRGKPILAPFFLALIGFAMSISCTFIPIQTIQGTLFGGFSIANAVLEIGSYFWIASFVFLLIASLAPNEIQKNSEI